MSDYIFRLRPQTSQCREALCLEDYEASWSRHQHIQFDRAGREAMGPDFEKFRGKVWGSSGYADGMRLRVRGRQDHSFSWSEIASEGRIEYADIQNLMDLGLVEFLVPSHRCLSSRVAPNWSTFPVRNRRDFLAVVKEMQELRPLHGEGMGNVFWPLCLPDASENPPLEKGGQAGFAEAMNSSLREFLLGAIALNPPGDEDWAEPCDGGDVEYYDVDLDQAICSEEESTYLVGFLQMGMENLVAPSLGHGLGMALAASARGIGKIAAEND